MKSLYSENWQAIKLGIRSSVVFLCITFPFFISFSVNSQSVGINASGTSPDSSALLDLRATDKGFLITRVDTVEISLPAFGLMTLAPRDSCLYMFSGENWISIGGVGSDCSCASLETPPPPHLLAKTQLLSLTEEVA